MHSAPSLWHIRSKMRIPHIAACQLIEPSQVCHAKCRQVVCFHVILIDMVQYRALPGNVLWLVSFNACTYQSLPAHLTIHLQICLIWSV